MDAALVLFNRAYPPENLNLPALFWDDAGAWVPPRRCLRRAVTAATQACFDSSPTTPPAAGLTQPRQLCTAPKAAHDIVRSFQRSSRFRASEHIGSSWEQWRCPVPSN